MESKSHDSQMRKLNGRVIGISVAVSEDLAHHGYSPEDVNRVTVRLSEALLSAGARLVFGHDWRPDGIMDAICRIAVRFQTLLEDRAPIPLVHNFVPWPDKPFMQSDLREELERRGVLKVETVGIPDTIWTSDNNPIARAIALTHLRRKLAAVTNARVCIGGKDKTGQGFFAGIVEEAYYAAVKKHPVFVGGFLGGAAAKLIAAIRHPNEKHPILEVIQDERQEKKKNFEEVATSEKYGDLVPSHDLSEGFKFDIMQKASGLSPSDWELSLNASDVEAFSALVIRGLSQLPKPDTKHLAQTSDVDSTTAPSTVPIKKKSAKVPTKRVSKKGMRKPPE